MLFEAPKMTEQICLKWNHFQENVNAAFGNLRSRGKKFADVKMDRQDRQDRQDRKDRQGRQDRQDICNSPL